ncbi:Putative polyketide synthase Pks16 [Mycobacteroides abscessus subsp. abscessus]|nr:Putative polyketide synthase Pks16 [Mycobacteroides abscessus subsp. abscessus]
MPNGPTRPWSKSNSPSLRDFQGDSNQRETFAVVVESNAFENPDEVRRIEQQVAHEVVAEVDVRPRNVVVLGPGSIPKTPSGKLRRSTSVALVI